MLCAHHNWLLLTQKEVNLSEILWYSKLPRKTTVKSLYLSRELKDHYIVACNNKRPVITFFHRGTTRVCETLHEMNIFSVSRHQSVVPRKVWKPALIQLNSKLLNGQLLINGIHVIHVRRVLVRVRNVLTLKVNSTSLLHLLENHHKTLKTTQPRCIISRCCIPPTIANVCYQRVRNTTLRHASCHVHFTSDLSSTYPC